VNVRGKRGNIVQTFPAIEYDFEPQHVYVRNQECLHFQWEGSNTHNNGNPAGDGQAGDAGEGRGGSDRSNIVQSKAMDESYPITYDKWDAVQRWEFFDYVTCYHPLNSNRQLSKVDSQLILGSAGFYRSKAYADAAFARVNTEEARLDKLLNNVSASFRQGLICCVKAGALDANDEDEEFSFISTRNNNFSNRDQKLKIVLTNRVVDTTTW
jgi:hypothetical protein